MIEPVHNAVPGRTRFRLENLKDSLSFKEGLEEALAAEGAVESVSANATTGSLLVHHDKDLDAEKLAELIEGAVKKIRRYGFSPSGKNNAAVAELQGGLEGGWHRMSASRTAGALSSDASRGLASAEAETRLMKFGPNALAESEARSGWSILKDQVVSLPSGLLGAAAGLSILTGGVLDALLIGGVLAANAAIGYYTEKESEKTISSLKKLVNHRTKVLREGKAENVGSDRLAPGDVIILRPGSYVPADCRIVESSDLTIDESSLTGESLPAGKYSRALKKKRMPLAEMDNMAFMGSVVTGGRGRAMVVATGANTQMGHMQAMLSTARAPRPPIERQLARTGDDLVKLWVAACAAVFGIGLLRGFSVMNILRTSVSLAAAAVPEGLPATATTTFALGVKDMKRHKVLVRNLQAVDTLGSVGTVCFDKTGTITENRMKVMQTFAGMHHFTADGGRMSNGEAAVERQKYPALFSLLEVGVLCSDVKINGRGSGKLDLSGTPTEYALVRLAEAHGMDCKKLRKSYELLEVNHRTEKQSIMSTVHRADGDRYFHAVKGRPSEVLELCDRQIKNGELAALTDEDRRMIRERNEAMAGDALRVLGFAGLESDAKKLRSGGGLVWYGLVGMADPVREGVADLVKAFHSAGVRTVMITGDQKITARAVARQLDLSGNGELKAMDAEELMGLDESELAGKVADVDVFSRVSPAHKLLIVQALQKAGRVVAMTGDGVNDGPALKAADVGIAMGEVGTDVTREAADVVLEDDDLETLVVAVRDGRSTYANIKKSVRFFLSTNLSETMVVFFSMAAGTGAVLSPMQLMWINVISDIFPGLALSMEPPDPKILDEKPRDPDASLFSRAEAGEMAVESGIMSAATLGVYGLGMLRHGAGPAAGAMAFQTLTIAQLMHALSCRSSRTFGRYASGSNPWLYAAVGGSLALQAGVFFLPGLRRILGVPRLGLADTLASIGGAGASLILNEFAKPLRRVNLPAGREKTVKDVAIEAQSGEQEVIEPEVVDEGQPWFTPKGFDVNRLLDSLRLGGSN